MMLNFELFLLETLHPIIDPKTNKPYRADKKFEQIKRFVNNSGISVDDLWLTFSDLPKLGVKPAVRTNKTTPHGVFGYPMRYYFSQKGSMPYASDRPFIIIFKVKGKILEVGHDTSKVRKLEKDPRVKSHVDYLRTIRKSDFPYSNFYAEINDLLVQNPVFNKLDESFRNIIFNKLRISRSEYPSSLEEAIADIQRTIFDLNNWQNSDVNWKNNIENFKSEFYDFNFYNRHADEYENIFSNYNIEANQYKLNPNYVRYLIEKNKPTIKPTMYNAYVNKIFKIEDLELIAPTVYRTYKNLVLNNKQNKNINYISFILNHLKKKVFEPVYVKYGPKENSNVRPKLPMEQQLSQICQELGISLEDAYKEMANDEKRTLTPSQILYKITKHIAKLSAKANPPLAKEGSYKSPNSSWYQQRWNEVLRKLGFAGVIDSKHTGNVHTSEPTQGAFVDPSKIEIVNIIHNKPGQYRNPKDMSWERSSSKHSYSYNPSYPRSGIFQGTEEERKSQALNQKLENGKNKFINSMNLTLTNLIKRGEDSEYFETAYKEAVNLLNQITFYKIAFSKEIKEDESKYEDRLKSNGGDSYDAMYAVQNKKTSYSDEIISSFKKLNSIKSSVFEKLNVFFKYVKYDGNEFWVKKLKALAKELDNPSKIILNKRIIPEKISFSIFKKGEEKEEKENFKLSEIPLPEQPEDSRLNKDFENLENAMSSLSYDIRRANENIYYGYKTDMSGFNKSALNALNLIIKIKAYYKDELENQKEEYLKGESSGINYWRKIKYLLGDMPHYFERLTQNAPKSPWAAWYQLATILKEVVEFNVDTNIGDIKRIQYSADLPDEEYVPARDDDNVPSGQGKTFEFYDDEPKSSLKSSEPEKSKDELTLQKSPSDENDDEPSLDLSKIYNPKTGEKIKPLQKSPDDESDDELSLDLDLDDDLPPLDLNLDDENDDELSLNLDDEDDEDDEENFEPLDLSLDDDDDDDDDNPFTSKKLSKNKVKPLDIDDYNPFEDL